MFSQKMIIINDIMKDIIFKSIQSLLLDILMSKIFPLILKLLKYFGSYSYYHIMIYLISAVSILFIIYKLYNYLHS